MEAIEESQVQSLIEGVKLNVVNPGTSVVSKETDLSHKSNGVAESVDAEQSVTGAAVSEADIQDNVTDTLISFTESSATESAITENIVSCLPEAEIIAAIETPDTVEHLLYTSASKITEVISEAIEGPEDDNQINEVTLESTVEVEKVGMSNDKVTFKTEILVEKHNDSIHEPCDTITDEHDNTNNILSELGQNIELSDVLRSSDTIENVENNNSGRQEVFNKEELLDILEGNDVATSGSQVTDKDPDSQKALEAQIALKQLSRLKRNKGNKKRTTFETKRKRSKSNEKHNERPPRKKKGEKQSLDVSNENATSTKENNNSAELNTSLDESTDTIEENSNTAEKRENNIVNVLVQDWDDDEPSETDKSNKLTEDGENLQSTCVQAIKSQEQTVITQEGVNRTSIDSPSCEGQNVSLNKSEDEIQPQRRFGRVIKKKIIFDPDNPDTFTKGKAVVKNKESPTEREQTVSKRMKTEEKQRSQSKSPTCKMSWKKPSQPKNSSKQNKRLTEIDKLLMDEGAVNMIYQLTPEAPKGKKNMKTKAEFIKKIQSSTPDGKEMKFRERKKEAARSEEEAKKILGGKQRASLSGSVKSPSVCEDFETHSADDSIIYRRHSSSSYSSACMSPRRLSDVEAGSVKSAARTSRRPSDTQNIILEATIDDQAADVFLAGAAGSEIINKDDCMSIKEKLNTKLSLALNKRKRDSNKGEKISKQKKASKAEKIKEESIKTEKNTSSLKHVSVTIDQRLAEINIGKTGSIASIEVLKELQQVLTYVDSLNDVSVTLLISECGTLCSDLDLRPLLDDNIQKRTNYAYELAESVRCLLCAVEQHSKLVVTGVWGTCAGAAPAMVALSDVALASELATFAAGGAPPLPGVAALSARCQLPQSLINESVVFGRCLTAWEAQRGGLVSRALWPERAPQQVRDIARDIAAQPPQSLLLKKQLLSLKKDGESKTTFLSSLEKERDSLIKYWTSVEGQEVIRAALCDG